MTRIGNEKLRDTGRMLEALTRKIRRHQGKMTSLEWKVIRLKLTYCIAEIDGLLGETDSEPKNLKSDLQPLSAVELHNSALLERS